MSNSLQFHRLQQARHPCPSQTPGASSNSCSLNWRCHPTISYSVIPFSSHLQSFTASGYFPMSQLFCIRWPKYWSFSFSSSPSNEHSGLISLGWISLQSKGLSRVFSNTTVQKHQFFGTQLSFGEHSGTPLQYSCLENPMDGGAW